MADDADMAQEKTDLLLNAGIEACRAKADPTCVVSGTGECIDCDEPIPAARQRAVPGCERCIDCQADFEEGQ